MLKNHLFATLFLFLGFQSCQAQQGLNKQDRKYIIERIGDLLEKHYVFPEVAYEMKAKMRYKYKIGVYNGFKDPKAFAGKLTHDLQLVSKDKHINIKYNPAWVEMRKRAQSTSNHSELDNHALEAARANNFGFTKAEILSDNIGYLKLDAFSGLKEAEAVAAESMKKLAIADALIIDLRDNGGGSPRMIQLLSSYLFDSKPRHLNSFYWRTNDKTTETWTLSRINGKRMPNVPVYILTSKNTFSAAEEFSYNLKHMGRATIVGETTGGGAHPGGRQIATDLFSIWLPQGRAINPITQTNWEGVGVIPHIQIESEEALERAKKEILGIVKSQ